MQVQAHPPHLHHHLAQVQVPVQALVQVLAPAHLLEVLVPQALQDHADTYKMAPLITLMQELAGATSAKTRLSSNHPLLYLTFILSPQ